MRMDTIVSCLLQSRGHSYCARATMACGDTAKNIKYVQEIEKHLCIYYFTLAEYYKREATYNKRHKKEG